MKTKYKLKINQPCSEDFTKFSPTEKGGFCKACQTNVVDFTKMSTEEITDYLKNNHKSETCGRFTQKQINQTYYNIQPKNNFSFFKGIGITLLSIFSLNSINAQEVKTETTDSNNDNKQHKSLENDISIKGTVLDEDGFLIADAYVFLLGTDIGTYTNQDGYFIFPEKLKQNDILIFEYLGLESKQFVIHNIKKEQEISITLGDENVHILGKVDSKKAFKSNKKFWKKKEK